VQFYQFTIQASNNSDDAFRHPMFLLLNMAIGGNWPGYPDASTPFPSSMFVDYVRVYQPATPSSIAEYDEFKWTIYPNPATDEISLQCNATPDECHVLDLSGKRILTFSKLSAQPNMDVSELAPGHYKLECFRNGRLYVQAFVKQ
jgi:hypothetical protein